jgi:hypothetical protein
LRGSEKIRKDVLIYPAKHAKPVKADQQNEKCEKKHKDSERELEKTPNNHNQEQRTQQHCPQRNRNREELYRQHRRLIISTHINIMKKNTPFLSQKPLKILSPSEQPTTMMTNYLTLSAASC